MGRILNLIYILLFALLAVKFLVNYSEVIFKSSSKPRIGDNGRIIGVNYKGILGPQKLVYVKNNNLYLFGSDGIRQLTFDGNVDENEYKFSRDGKYLVWKSYNTTEDADSAGYDKTNLPVTLLWYGILENTTPKVILQDTDTASESANILGFDFLGNKSLDIVYILSNGDVWKKNIENGNREQLYNDESNEIYRRGDVKSNKAGAILMIEKAETNCLTREFYNIFNQRTESYDHQGDCYFSDSVIWTNSGDGVISYNRNNSSCADDGLFITYLNSNKGSRIFPTDKNEHISIDSLSISGASRNAVSISPLSCAKNGKKVKEGIYVFSNESLGKLLFPLAGKNISWTSDGKKITYLIHGDKDYDLYIIDGQGKDNLLFLKGITSYKWLPLLQSESSETINIRQY